MMDDEQRVKFIDGIAKMMEQDIEGLIYKEPKCDFEHIWNQAVDSCKQVLESYQDDEDELELSDEAMEKIRKGIEAVKQGKVQSFDDMMKNITKKREEKNKSEKEDICDRCKYPKRAHPINKILFPTEGCKEFKSKSTDEKCREEFDKDYDKKT